MGAFGDTVILSSPVDKLALQVNRFGPSAPSAYRFHATDFATGKPLDIDLASTAMLIYQRRAIDSFAQFQDSASKALIDKANAGMADPVTWVQANLGDVTGVIKGYGDSVGLPAAPSTGILDKVSDAASSVPVWGWVAAGAGALLLLRRKGRR